MIDPEFAFYGPMGFDIGAYVGNLLLAYCAVPGNGQGEAYGDWLLGEVRPMVLTVGRCPFHRCLLCLLEPGGIALVLGSVNEDYRRCRS